MPPHRFFGLGPEAALLVGQALLPVILGDGLSNRELHPGFTENHLFETTNRRDWPKMLFKNNVVTHGTGCTFECEGDRQGTLAEDR